MAPEYGATIGFFPVDDETLDYLRITNRSAGTDRAGGGVYEGAGPVPSPDCARIRSTTDTLELDLATVTRRWPGPKRPQDRIELNDVKKNFLLACGRGCSAKKPVNMDEQVRKFRTAPL